MVESTYGDRLHDPEDPKVALARIINDAAQRQAPVLIPAFAVGRTQEIVYLIRELEDENAIPILPVIVDSPMAAATTAAYSKRKEEHDEDYASILTQHKHPLRTRSMTAASSREESKRTNNLKGARVIVSASGMMTGGRVLHHALRMVPDPEATVVFVGFQAAGTTGRRILDGEQEVKILGQWVPVRCRTAGSAASRHTPTGKKFCVGWKAWRAAYLAKRSSLTANQKQRTRWPVTSTRDLVGIRTCRSTASESTWCKLSAFSGYLRSIHIERSSRQIYTPGGAGHHR